MNLRITPQQLHGAITPPASKSQAHRLIMGAALAGGSSVLRSVSGSNDITATLGCMEALGAKSKQLDDTTLQITGNAGNSAPAGQVLDCGESGSTLRFLIPIALALTGNVTFWGHGRLMQRPQTPYFEIFQEKGIEYHLEGDLLTVRGALTPGQYSLRGDVSSQFITGLLYALPLLHGDSDIVLTTQLESESYVNLTLDALRQFGITIVSTAQGWHIPGNQAYTGHDLAVEADYSQSGFFYAAQGIGNPVSVTGMNPDSVQGDRIILPYMDKLNGTGLVDLDVRDCPDLVPPLALRAALRNGETTVISGAARLRLKESDRLASVTAVLGAMGANIDEGPDSLTIHGAASLQGGVTVDSWGDHRIAMMAAMAATVCREPITLTGAESVRKSYPGFWDDYCRLGGSIQEVSS